MMMMEVMMDIPFNIFTSINNKLLKKSNTFSEKQKRMLNELIKLDDIHYDNEIYLCDLIYSFFKSSIKATTVNLFFNPDKVNMEDIYVDKDVDYPNIISFTLVDDDYTFRDLEIKVENMGIDEFIIYILDKAKEHFSTNDFAFLNNSNYDFFNIDDIKKEISDYKEAKVEGKTLMNMLTDDVIDIVLISFLKKVTLVDDSNLYINKLIMKDRINNIDGSKHVVLRGMDTHNNFFNISNKIIFAMSKDKIYGTKDDYVKVIYENI